MASEYGQKDKDSIYFFIMYCDKRTYAVLM